MKLRLAKIVCSFLILACSGKCFAIDNKYAIKIDNEDCLGTYLPVNYIEALTSLKSHNLAMIKNKDNQYHDVIAVNKDIAYSSLGYHDQYAIPATDFMGFVFALENGEYILIDENGFKYRKISDEYINYEDAVKSFIATKMLEHLMSQYVVDFLIRPNGDISINGSIYSIIIDRNFFPTNNIVILYSKNEKNFACLIERDAQIELHNLLKGKKKMYEVSDTALSVFLKIKN